MEKLRTLKVLTIDNSVIILIFKSGEKNNPSNYWNIMINLYLSYPRFTTSFQKRKHSVLIESEGSTKRDNQVFQYFKEITLPCTATLHLQGSLQRTSKSNIFYFFVDIRKYFHSMTNKNNMDWKILKGSFRVDRIYNKVVQNCTSYILTRISWAKRSLHIN